LLVALSCPEATFVAGFRAWLKLGYCVRKGEKAIRIIAPMPITQRETETADTNDETRVLFKGVSVFDRSQVAPIDGTSPAPLEPPSEPLTGDSHRHLIDPMRAFAESLGFTISFETIPGATGGWCDQKTHRIVVDADQPANAQLRILIHETIHGLGVGYAEFGRARAEVIVDTGVFSPCQGLSSETGWLRASVTGNRGREPARDPGDVVAGSRYSVAHDWSGAAWMLEGANFRATQGRSGADSASPS
jgi:N-terminal domain of anti-restriction factor ArdC